MPPLMSGSSWETYEQYARNYYLLVDPLLRNSKRYEEIYGVVLGLSYESDDLLTVVPRAETYRAFTSELVEFLRKVTLDGRAVDLVRDHRAAMLVLRWEREEENRAESRASTGEPREPRLGVPVQVLATGIDHLFGNDLSAGELVEELIVLYRDPFFAYQELRDQSKDGAGVIDYIVIKPTVGGVGVDLGKVAKRMLGGGS